MMDECEHEETKSPKSGETVCKKCGLVMQSLILSNKNYSLAEVKNSEYHETGYCQAVAIGKVPIFVGNLGTEIGSKYLSPQRMALFNRLRRHNFLVRHHNRERDVAAISKLRDACKDLRVPIVVWEEAAISFHHVLKHAKKGEITNRILLVACCLITSIRHHQVPIRFREVLHFFNSSRITQRTVIKLLLTLKIKHPILFVTTLISPVRFLPRIISDLRASPKVKKNLEKRWVKDPIKYWMKLEKKTHQLMKKIKRKGEDPFSYTVTALFAVSRCLGLVNGHEHFLTQTLLGDILDIGNYTIRGIWLTRFKPKMKEVNQTG